MKAEGLKRFSTLEKLTERQAAKRPGSLSCAPTPQVDGLDPLWKDANRVAN